MSFAHEPTQRRVGPVAQPAAGHYSLPSLAAYVLDQAGDLNEAIGKHVGSCPACAERVHSLRQTLKDLDLPAARAMLRTEVLAQDVRDAASAPDSPIMGPQWDRMSRRLAELFSSGASAGQMVAESGLTPLAILTVLCEQRPARPSAFAAEANTLANLLRARSRCLRGVTVFPGSDAGAGTGQRSWEERIEDFGCKTAPFLVSLLADASYVGVGWGRMVTGAVTGIISTFEEAPPRLRGPLQCVATVGGFVQEEKLHDPSSSSILARQLSWAINRDHEHAHLLQGVEAFIASYLGEDVGFDEVEMVRRRTARFYNYQAIFGGPGRAGMMHQLDAIVTSCGNAHHYSNLWRTGLALLGIEPERVNELTHGNISGVLLPREDLDDAGKADLENISRRWTGITRQHFEQCAQRSPGVIVLAIGNNKADVVFECVKLNLVTELIIDDDLAMALWDRVDPEKLYPRVLDASPTCGHFCEQRESAGTTPPAHA